MKKAVVATSVGAEGLDVVDGRHLLLADTPDQFAERVLRLLGDASLRRRLGDDGRRLVEERYGWDRLADKLYEYLKDLVAPGTGTRSGPKI
jgi:glycosyltransferase involved in cell wall biosynthesis